MTIGYILDDNLDQSDGVQQAVISIAEKMRKLGHDVHYIVPRTERTDLENVHSIAKVIALKFNGNSIRTPIWSSKKRIKALFSDVKFDVLHVQMPYSPLMSARVINTAPASTRIVGTFHILPYSWSAKYGTKLLGFVLKHSKKRIAKAFAVSKPALAFMKKDFGLAGSVLANPVDYNYFHQFANKKTKQTKKRIVFLGRFEERKGVNQLVEAYEQLPNREDVELVMCGKGPLWESINSISKAKGLNITLPGFVNETEKAEYLASAEVAVFPSTSGESFGIVLTEAMSSGAGVTIGGNNPGYSSVLEQWPETIFNPNDIAEFSNKLQTMLENDEVRNHLGALQHEAVKQYDIHNIVKSLESAYNE